MTLVPLIDRELRTAARRPATHRARMFSALGVLLVWFLLLIASRASSSAELSRALFTAVGVLALGFSLLAGVFLTADCLSEEKREGTMGLLFLTDLRAYDIVLAKVIANSIQSVYGLLAVLPVSALPLLMGGVSPGEFCRVALAVLATLLLSISFGACVSASSREARQAMTRTLGGLLLVAGILPALWWLWFSLSAGRGWNLLLWFSPVFAFRSAFDMYYHTAPGPQDFWGSLLLIGFLGLGSLAASIALLPRTWRETNCGPVNRDDNLLSRDLADTGTGVSEVAMGLLEADPGLWLALREAACRKAELRWCGVLVGLWFCFLAASILTAYHKEAFVCCLLTAVALHWVVKYFVATEATRQLSADHQTGALELLLATPLREVDILRGQALVLRCRFKGLAATVTLINLALGCVVMVFHGPLAMQGTDQAVFLELFCGGILTLWLDLRALAIAGPWMALRHRRHSRAILATLGRVMLVPWAGLFLMVFFMSQARGISTGQLTLLFASWFMVGMVNALAVAARARTALGRGFRSFLFERAPRPQIPFASVGGIFSPPPAQVHPA